LNLASGAGAIVSSGDHSVQHELVAHILDSIDDAITAVDLKGTVVYWNVAAELLYGLRGAEALGMNFQDIFHNVWGEYARAIEQFNSRKIIAPYITRRERFDGRVVDVSVRLSPIRNDEGHLVGVSGIARDVTAQLQLERDRQELATRLLRVEEYVAKNIAADIHDGPLQTLIASSLRLRMLQKRLGDTESASIDAIYEAMTESISELRSIMFDVAPPALDSGGLIESLREYFERFHDLASDMTLLFESPGSLGLSKTEATILYRIGREAIGNALKHSGGTEIRISAQEIPEGIQLTIRDNGRGSEVLQSPPGHLGLTTMVGLARRSGGDTVIASVVGEGTSVTAWIPRSEN